jgi:hypothetical protein
MNYVEEMPIPGDSHHGLLAPARPGYSLQLQACTAVALGVKGDVSIAIEWIPIHCRSTHYWQRPRPRAVLSGCGGSL